MKRSTASVEPVARLPLALCATPIGNLDDVTLRVLDELRHAELVLCEDTRRTRLLLDRHRIEVAGRLLSYHEHNEARRTAELLPKLQSGARVALAVDAGMPGVSDPGARLLKSALAAGVPVTVLPGPSAVETALVASGLLGTGYRFVGFLPRKQNALRALWEELGAVDVPTVAFESPQRLPAALAALADVDPGRQVAVCRELTKRFEEVARGTAAELAERFSTPPKGEITIVLGERAGAGREARSSHAAARAVEELVALGIPRGRAAGVVARLTGVPRATLYHAS
jgi:16S rRNA (cytidine1402-2'-O)-methyltransferase